MNNVQRICEEQIPGQYDLTIIDVLENPDVLERENIIFTPITIRELPLPKIRAEGDLTGASEEFIKAFGLYPEY